MDPINVPKKLFFAGAGGLVGFFRYCTCGWYCFCGSTPSRGIQFWWGDPLWQDNLFIAIFVPMLISLGAAIPAWGLGAKWWHGLLAGIIAMIVFIYIESNGRKYVDYLGFSQRETLNK